MEMCLFAELLDIMSGFIRGHRLPFGKILLGHKEENFGVFEWSCEGVGMSSG